MIPRATPVTVFLVDDHSAVRDAVRMLLEVRGDVVVVGEAATCATALRQISQVRPDVAILDVGLPDGSGIDLCRRITDAQPATACVVLTALADDDLVDQASHAGAAAFVLKDVVGHDLANIVQRAAGRHRPHGLLAHGATPR